MVARSMSKMWWRRFQARNGRPYDELDTFRQMAPDEQRRDLAQRLFAQIQHFGRRDDALPEWRDAARTIQDPDGLWRDWTSLPVLDKAMLRSRFDPDQMRTHLRLDGIRKSTGGSTGEPTHFFHDTAMIRAGVAASLYAQVKMGWRPGMATIKVWGSERDLSRESSLYSKVTNRIGRIFLVDGYRMTRQTALRVVDLVRRHAPVAVTGFSSMLAYVAQEALASGDVPPPAAVKTAWNGGEMLFADYVESFRKAFGTPILNFYGGRELSAMACQFQEGDPLWIMRPWLFAEIVDDHGRPVSPGQAGRILWTSTVCRGTPFLRYDVGDIGVYSDSHQSESGISAIRELQGRVAGLLKLPDGKTISCLYWNHLFKECPEVRQFQVVMKRDGSIQFLLRGERFTSSREAELTRILRNFLGEIPVHFSWVERIPLTKQGKLEQVVHENGGRP